MSSIPIFDSLMHPMPDKGWLDPSYAGKNDIEDQLDSMRQHNIRWGLAVGLGPTIGRYNETSYADFVRQHANFLYPVAYCDFTELQREANIEPYLSRLKSLGYIGIKIHPRIADVTFDHPLLDKIISSANQLGLSVLLCTYFWTREGRTGSGGLGGLANLLAKIPDEKLVLLHGGAVRLLEMAEVARQFPSVLLDLSFTLCKYEKSSLDADIRYLFNKFDQRICIGSDNPEFCHGDLRRRFEEFSSGLDSEKASNIAYRNLQRHLNIDAEN